MRMLVLLVLRLLDSRNSPECVSQDFDITLRQECDTLPSVEIRRF